MQRLYTILHRKPLREVNFLNIACWLALALSRMKPVATELISPRRDSEFQDHDERQLCNHHSKDLCSCQKRSNMLAHDTIYVVDICIHKISSIVSRLNRCRVEESDKEIGHLQCCNCSMKDQVSDPKLDLLISSLVHLLLDWNMSLLYGSHRWPADLEDPSFVLRKCSQQQIVWQSRMQRGTPDYPQVIDS